MTVCSASIWSVMGPSGAGFELAIMDGRAKTVFGPADLDVPALYPLGQDAAQSAADEMLTRQGWTRTSEWAHNTEGEMFADVERTPAPKETA